MKDNGIKVLKQPFLKGGWQNYNLRIFYVGKLIGGMEKEVKTLAYD